jgi:hypothetical protein
MYAIRDRESGLFLPAHKQSRGFSFDEPSSDRKPRLFFNTESAKKAPAAWLRGYHNPIKDDEGFGLFTVGYKIEKVESRKKRKHGNSRVRSF